MKPVEVLFPATEEELRQATELVEAGKAASGEDGLTEEQVESLPDEESLPELPVVESKTPEPKPFRLPKVPPSPFKGCKQLTEKLPKST